MHYRWATSRACVAGAALLALVTGCGVSKPSAPQPLTGGDTAASPTVAQGGPQLGYVWDGSTQSLNGITGIPAAARVGARVTPAGVSLVRAAAAGAGAAFWSLMLQPDGALSLMQLPSQDSKVLVTGVAADSTIAFSPSATSAVVASASRGAVLVVTGLPSTPQVAHLSLPSQSLLTGEAVSDAGTVVVGIAQAGSSAVQVTRMAAGAASARMTTVQAWGGAAFLPPAVGAKQESLLVADSTAAQLTLIDNVGAASPALRMIPAKGMLQTASGVGISRDGLWAFVADSGKSKVVRISLATDGVAPSAMDCTCQPQQMQLIGNGIFLVAAGAPGQPLWMLDTQTANPRIFFVPAAPGNAETQRASR